MAANITEIRANETTALITPRMIAPNGRYALMMLPSAEIAALAMRETSNRKPSAATNPRLAARARTRRDNELPCGSTFHIVFNASCISPKTPEAVTNKVTTPMTVAQVPDDLPDALSSAV